VTAEGPSAAARAYLSASPPDPSTPWRQAGFVAVDLELTGLDPARDEIISFAAIAIAGGRVRLSDAVTRIVRPERMPGPETIRIHGLREQDLAQAPPLDAVLDDLLGALSGRVLVAHVAPIEEGFLRAALAARGLELRNPVVDTDALGAELRRLRRQPPPRGGEAEGDAVSTPGLSRLARSLGLPVHRPHHADGDALTTAQVFVALATHLDALRPQTVGSLVRVPRPRGPGRSMPGSHLGRFVQRAKSALTRVRFRT
jgi:DNA polymerase III subunit epsilon